MKTILCYGDSNTWGFIPGVRERYPADIRWTGVLQAELGSAYHVIEEGLNGRTTVWDDPVGDHASGLQYFYPCLQSHKPLDLVIIMLGTNDLKYRFHLNAFDIAESVGRLCAIARSSLTGPAGSAPKVLAACPAPITETGEFLEMFEGGARTSRVLHRAFERMGKELDVPVFFVDEVAASSPVDGIHLSREAHAAIGGVMAERVKSLVGAS